MCIKKYHKEASEKNDQHLFFKLYILSHPSQGEEGRNDAQCFVEKQLQKKIKNVVATIDNWQIFFKIIYFLGGLADSI